MKRQSPPFSAISRSAAAAAKLLQSCPTLCDSIDSNPTGSPIPGILQARILERVAILSYSVKAPQPGRLVCPVTKSTAIIPIRDRGQGWQWKSIDILIARSLSFCRALICQLPECSWSKAEESSSFCHALTSQLPEWLQQGSVSFRGEGHCLWNQILRKFLWSQTAFQVSSSQEVADFLTLVWWIQGMTPITLTAVGVARTTVWGPVQTGWSGSLIQSLTHTSSPADRDEPNCPKEWVSFLRFLRWYGGRLFPGPGGVGTSPGQLVVGGLPWDHLILELFYHWGWSPV